MPWKGIKHNQVGEELDSTEFHSEDLHELQSGTTLPPTENNDGDFYYKTDTHRLYMWKQE